MIVAKRLNLQAECSLGSGPKVKSRATVLWSQTQGLRVPLWGQTQGLRFGGRPKEGGAAGAYIVTSTVCLPGE